MDRVLRLAALFLTLGVVVDSGCAKSASSSTKLQGSHVRVLTNLYSLATRTLGRVPRDADEFKQTIAKLDVNLKKYKVNSIDELFISERDGQPLIVAYGPDGAKSDVVVYEQNGVDRKRMVGHRSGMLEEVDEAELKNLTASKR